MNSTYYTHCQPGLLLENIGGDQEIFLQLAEIFQRESVAIFERMRAAALASNFEQLGRESHSLKGTVGPLGADKLVDMLVEIEDECNSSQCVCDERKLLAIADALHHVRTELRHFIDNS